MTDSMFQYRMLGLVLAISMLHGCTDGKSKSSTVAPTLPAAASKNAPTPESVAASVDSAKPISAVHEYMAGEGTPINSACFSHDSMECFLAIGKKIEVRSTLTWQLHQTLAGHRNNIRRIRLSSDGTLLASAGEDALIQIRAKLPTVERWEVDQTIFLPAPANRVEWSPDDRWLAVGLSVPDISQTIQLYDIKNGELDRSFKVPFIPNTFGFSRDGTWLAVGGINAGEKTESCQIYVWNTATWNTPRIMVGHLHGIEAIAFAADGSEFYSTAADAAVTHWSMETGISRTITRLPFSGTSLSMLDDARHAIISWHFANLGILDLKAGSIVARMEGHPESQKALMRDVVVSNDRRWAISCCNDNRGLGTGNAKLWRLPSLKK